MIEIILKYLKTEINFLTDFKIEVVTDLQGYNSKEEI